MTPKHLVEALKQALNKLEKPAQVSADVRQAIETIQSVAELLSGEDLLLVDTKYYKRPSQLSSVPDEEFLAELKERLENKRNILMA